MENQENLNLEVVETPETLTENTQNIESAEPVETPEPACCCEAPENVSPDTGSAEKKHCCCKVTPTCLMCANIVLFIGLVLIYIFHFAGIGTHSKYNPDASAPMVAEGGVLKVAYVDSDTLLAKYQYAIDLQEELNQYRDQQMASGQRQMEQFQKDYNDFIQNGEKMTLTQQQAKEAELKQRYEKLSTLEAEVTNKVMQKQLESNIELLNRIFAFVREYNAANQQFDIILRKTFVDSPTIYMNPGMDITDEIINGLNEEYKTVKKK